ncbi:MAG: DUF354 domain-containing protein [Candidatus Bathyarchaeia archaeon]
MIIWYDACTGKQVRYGVTIARRLRKLGHEVLLTTRQHPDTIPLARLLKEEFIVIGKYNPKSNMSRLMESIKRQKTFCKMFRDKAPNIAISHCSVELCRVAFGLGIPSIATYDTTHADAVSRLTVPIVNFLVVSKAIPKEYVERYCPKRILWFEGVDEVAWIKDFKPMIKYDYRKPLIVVRQLEKKAAYAHGKTDPLRKIIFKLASLGTVVYLPRYKRTQMKGVIVPEDFVDSASLVAQADLVVSFGGTIAREAALQGIPSLVIKVFENIFPNEYLAKNGFPIFTVKPEEVLDYAKKLLGNKWDVRDKLATLKNPVDVIEGTVNKIEKGQITV